MFAPFVRFSIKSFSLFVSLNVLHILPYHHAPSLSSSILNDIEQRFSTAIRAAIMMLDIVRAKYKFIDGGLGKEEKNSDYVYLQNKFATATAGPT